MLRLVPALALALVGLLAACGPPAAQPVATTTTAPTSMPEPAATNTPRAGFLAGLQTRAAESTPRPTNTPRSTNTPRPPTNTPAPTSTRMPPTETPAPPAPAASPTSTPMSQAPTPVASQPAGSVTIIRVVGAVPGSNATVEAQAPAGAQCSISYRTPAGTVSEAQELVPRVAGADGRASWTWRIGPGTRTGQGRVTVRCEPGGSATAPITIG